MDEGKQLARICSQERELYSKVLPVLKWIRTNIQISEVEEMKAASADYLGVELTEECKILPSALKRTSGAMMSTKKKRSGVKSEGTSSSRSRPCTLCGEFGHFPLQCTKAQKLGMVCQRCSSAIFLNFVVNCAKVVVTGLRGQSLMSGQALAKVRHTIFGSSNMKSSCL